jgi:hypothetical protein
MVGGQGAETRTETVIHLPTVRLIDQSLDSVEFAEGTIITSSRLLDVKRPRNSRVGSQRMMKPLGEYDDRHC